MWVFREVANWTYSFPRVSNGMAIPIYQKIGTIVGDAWHAVVKYSAGKGLYNGYDTLTFWQSTPAGDITLPDDACAADVTQNCSRPYKHSLMPFFWESHAVKEVISFLVFFHLGQ